MEKPWLSVVIPCRNGQRWLNATLRSIVDQREQGLEIIFVDGSTDNASWTAVDSFANRLNIRAFRRPDLETWMAKTNFGVEQAGADHICTLHTDDVWLPDKCAKVGEWLENQPAAAMHLHPCYIIDENGRRLGLWRCPLPVVKAPIPAHLLYERLLVQNFIGIPAPIIRRNAYLRVGGLDESLWYTADWDLYLKLASAGNVHYHPEPLACFRVHKNSLTVMGSRDTVDFRNQHQIIIDRYLDRLPPRSRGEMLQIFNASVDVNVALAMAVGGKYGEFLRAIYSVLALGPRRMGRYFFYSRIIERTIPRLRALASGRF